MSIPESQLDVWSYQGAATQSKDTYATIRRALEADGTGYADKAYSIFLQGSYCNDTNVYADSDVDIVIATGASYFHDLGDIPDDQRAVFQQQWVPATYLYPQFKADVVTALRRQFGTDVNVGNKAITIEAGGGRRKADVIAAMEFRQYYSAASYSSYYTKPALAYHEGICLFRAGGAQVVNYPKQHSENLTRKHQATQGWFKPTVRVLKNLRNRLLAEGTLQPGDAPSYFLEGMLYNVPDSYFGASFTSTLVDSMNWLLQATTSELVCANERYYLVRDGASNCWPTASYAKFLDILVTTWNHWQ